MQPVNRLPLEILSQIVQCVPHQRDTDTGPIIRLTHVCRYWREFIISTPSNWTLISSRSKSLTALSLKRSKGAPLELRLNMLQVRSNPGFSDLLLPHTRNTRILDIDSILTIEELTQEFPNFLQSMPNLRSLELWRKDTTGGWDPSIDPFEPLPHALRSLSLFSIHLYPSFLRLTALTKLLLHNKQFNLHVDALLDFLEENRSLESADLEIRFSESSLRNSQRGSVVVNRLQLLSITCADAEDARALSSNIALRRGAHLEISCRHPYVELNDILSGVSTAHHSNLCSPTFLEYRSNPREIQLHGPNGRFSYIRFLGAGNPFGELSLFPLTSIRELRLACGMPPWEQLPPTPYIFGWSLPALEVLAIERNTSISRFLSPLFLDPSSTRSLKILAFLNCAITDEFIEGELTRFADDRKKSASTWLHRVVVVSGEGRFPSIDSIHVLQRHVAVVEMWMGNTLPTDLT